MDFLMSYLFRLSHCKNSNTLKHRLIFMKFTALSAPLNNIAQFFVQFLLWWNILNVKSSILIILNVQFISIN